MINSWQQFCFSEERIARSLCLLGIAFGLAIGIISKDWAESFRSIEVIGYQIPPLIAFGIAGGLTIQLVSVLLSWATLYWSAKLYQNANLYYFWIIQILLGIPIGVLVVFNIFSGYSVAIGFVIPYVLALILYPIVMIFVGWDTMHLLLFNAISLLPLYIVSTGIIWFVEYCRSIISSG
jgi:hypothetical protein